ncbi:type VII secretion protein EssB [Streptococcus caprae]|uniref:Type VII secretion protein EssB n=1 Tax=Streptococcus caprae TaxID=1640501 RepID=A0ABV8CW84_9STRE
MTRTEFTFDKQLFVVNKETDRWEVPIKRSAIATHDTSELLLLNVQHPLFLPLTYQVDADQVNFSYQLEEDGRTFTQAKAQSLAEKLRLSLNITEFQTALDLPISFLLHPENVFITKNGQFRLAHRGLPGIMVPLTKSEDDLLRQVKCLIMTLFTEESFTDLYEGALEVVEVPEFLSQLRQQGDFKSLTDYLKDLYRLKSQEEDKQTSRVSKQQFKLFKYASIWSSVLAVLLLVPLIYLVFVRGPFMQNMLDADTAFIKQDYSTLIDELDHVSLGKLPYTQKYELATAFVTLENLSDEQRTIVLNNVTLKSDELYLDYWITIGRGETETAVDTAKRLDDVDLILYALATQIQETRQNSTLSGQEREEKLDELTSDYERYWEQRSTNLTDSLDKDGNSVETETSVTTSSEDATMSDASTTSGK